MPSPGRSRPPAPTAVDLLHAPASQSSPRGAGHALQAIQVAIGQQHLRRAVDRIFFAGVVLIAEPQRHPTAVGMLLRRPDSASRVRSPRRFAVRTPSASRIAVLLDVGAVSQLALPGVQGPQGVGRQVAAAAVERQRAPAAAKRRPAAVAVLQVEQPVARRAAAARRILARRSSASACRPGRQRQQGPGVSSASGTPPAQIGPGPAARLGAGVDGCASRCWHDKIQSRQSQFA